MDPKVSVIIPVYNTEQYLAECLDSVINQTLREIEIIVINDKSPDALEAFMNWLEQFSNQENISFVVSVSADPETVPESVRARAI